MIPAPRPAATVFRWPVRVYYEDTDAGGVVYYANYLKFLERARTEWLRAAGFELPELARDHDVIFVVRALALDYLGPARLNDALAVTVKPLTFGASTIHVAQTVERDRVLVQARVTLACVSARQFKPMRIPAALRSRLEARF